MNTISWIENNNDFKDWVETIIVTAKLMGYITETSTFNYAYGYDPITHKPYPRPGTNWTLEITMNNISAYLIICFENNMPARLEVSEHLNVFKSNDINHLPKFQKILEEWII